MDTIGAKQMTHLFVKKSGGKLIVLIVYVSIIIMVEIEHLRTNLGKEANKEADSLAKHEVDLDNIFPFAVLLGVGYRAVLLLRFSYITSLLFYMFFFFFFSFTDKKNSIIHNISDKMNTGFSIA